MKKLMFAITLLLLSSACLAELPTRIFYMPGYINVNSFFSTQLKCGAPLPIVVMGIYEDLEYKGFSFELGDIHNKVYPLSPKNRWVRKPCTGYAFTYYPQGFPNTTAFTPAGSKHSTYIRGAMANPNITQWLTQTNGLWAGDDYGQSRKRHIINKGCCMTAAAMTLSSWLGKTITPKTLNAYLLTQPDGYRGDYVGWDAVIRFARTRYGVKFRYIKNMPLGEAMARGYPIIAKCNTKEHWVFAFGYYNGQHDYMIKDPFGRYLNGEGYYGGIGRQTRLLIPVSNADWQVPSPMYYNNDDYENFIAFGVTPMSKMFGYTYITASTPVNDTEVDDIGRSMITAYTEDAVQLKFDKMFQASNFEIPETAEPDGSISVENDGDGTLLEAQVGQGNYQITVSGTPNTAFSINVWQYDFDGNPKQTTHVGILDSLGLSSIEVIQL